MYRILQPSKIFNMKKFFAIVLVAACMTACNSNADGGGSKDSTTTSGDSGMTAPSGVDTSTLRTDTSGPKPDSGLSR
jgi:uncharacterized protein YdeI (BOF family)